MITEVRGQMTRDEMSKMARNKQQDPYYDKEKFKKLCEEYKLSLVILHGSYSRQTASAKSDIDIGFLGQEGLVGERYFDILNDLTSIFGDRIDPVFLNGAEAMITYHVAVYGRPLYERQKGLFNAFRLGALLRYFDTKKFRLLEKQYIKSAIQGG